jgi:hypothetical protein
MFLFSVSDSAVGAWWTGEALTPFQRVHFSYFSIVTKSAPAPKAKGPEQLGLSLPAQDRESWRIGTRPSAGWMDFLFLACVIWYPLMKHS